MIVEGFSFIAFIVAFAALVFAIKEKTKSKFFDMVPPLVIIYFGSMLFSTFGLWQLKVDGLATGAGIARGEFKSALLPSMIFLMLLRADLRQIAKLGSKMLIAFFCATLSIMLGFVIAFAMFKGGFTGELEIVAKSFGALGGSWIGGTQNMVAVQEVFNLGDAQMGYTLLIDSIDYSIWIMILIYFVSSKIFVEKFNKFTKADTKVIEEIAEGLQDLESGIRKEITFSDIFSTLGLGLGVGAFLLFVGTKIPDLEIGGMLILNSTGWTIVLATIAGIGLAMTSLSKLPSTKEIANVMLYINVALIAASANFMELTEAPLYIIAGFVILIVHGGIMVVVAKLFKLDLFTCAVASCANIGGVASSPVIAGAYDETLVPVGVLMGMLGVIVGTLGGVIVGNILLLMI